MKAEGRGACLRNNHDRPVVPEVYFFLLAVLFFFWLRSLSLVPVSNRDLLCANFFPRCVIGSVLLQNSELSPRYIEVLFVPLGSCLVLSISLKHCGNEFRNSVPVRTSGLWGV